MSWPTLRCSGAAASLGPSSPGSNLGGGRLGHGGTDPEHGAPAADARGGDGSDAASTGGTADGEPVRQDAGGPATTRTARQQPRRTTRRRRTGR